MSESMLCVHPSLGSTPSGPRIKSNEIKHDLLGHGAERFPARCSMRIQVTGIRHEINRSLMKVGIEVGAGQIVLFLNQSHLF